MLYLQCDGLPLFRDQIRSILPLSTMFVNPSTMVGNPSTLVENPHTTVIGNLTTMVGNLSTAAGNPSTMDGNFVNSILGSVKGSATTLRLLNCTFKPQAVGIQTTQTTPKIVNAFKVLPTLARMTLIVLYK